MVFARDARLPGVGDDAATVERVDHVVRQRDAARRDFAAEPEPERAAHRRRVVVLPAAGDSEVLDLEAAALFGEARRS